MLFRMIFPILIVSIFLVEVENSQSIEVLAQKVMTLPVTRLHELGGANLTYCLFHKHTFNNCTLTLCVRTAQIKLG